MLIVWMAILGALGALARWGLNVALSGLGMAAGAFAANVLGCGLFGLVLQLASVNVIGPQLRLVLLVGFLGSLTTFSTYLGDVVALVREDRVGAAAACLLAHNSAGVLALLAGMRAARWLG